MPFIPRKTLARLARRVRPTPALAPGKERWSTKTATDTGAFHIDASSPVVATVADMHAWPVITEPTTRTGPYETTIYSVQATLTKAHLESDGDWHCVLEDQDGKTAICELADPAFCAGSAWLTQITQVRSTFETAFGTPEGWITPNRTVTVVGPGFRDKVHGQVGVIEPGGWEIHPVISLTLDVSPSIVDPAGQTNAAAV